MSGPKAKDGGPRGPSRDADEDPHNKDTSPPSNGPRYRELAGGPASYRIAAPESRDRGPASRGAQRPPLGAAGLLGDPYAMGRVPTVILTGERFRNAMLDRHEGFVVSLVDGQLDVESIVDIAGLPEDDVLEILEGLRLSGVLALR